MKLLCYTLCCLWHYKYPVTYIRKHRFFHDVVRYAVWGVKRKDDQIILPLFLPIFTVNIWHDICIFRQSYRVFPHYRGISTVSCHSAPYFQHLSLSSRCCASVMVRALGQAGNWTAHSLAVNGYKIASASCGGKIFYPKRSPAAIKKGIIGDRVQFEGRNILLHCGKRHNNFLIFVFLQ